MIRPLVLSCLLTVCCFGAEAPHVRNFATVNDHLLRGGEPSETGLTELGLAGVKVVIDLREHGAATELEKQEAEKLGMKYTNVPFAPWSAPTQAQVQLVLRMLAENQSQTVFLHCRRGKDRTGTMVACYRIQHDGWDNRRALEEAKHYGMSATEVGMRAFVLHFQPQIITDKPAIF